jgi:glycosyltransferase involved in cell wall biosynthesis
MENTAIPILSKPNKSQATLPQHLICFSHLRWDFVFQRPQHLLSRLSDTFNVFFIEEPVFDAQTPHFSLAERDGNITVVVPHLPDGTNNADAIAMQRALVNEFLETQDIQQYAAWYYTPMALQFSGHLNPAITIYDCMDELSAFKFAPAELKVLEAELMRKADVVFTGGHSLYESKKTSHNNIHPFPSSVDKKHFGKARNITASPGDQSRIAAPRIGFFGVIDERFDIGMIEDVARQRPEWHFILIGPIVKIDPASLPRLDNIHYLGGKSYNELPDYISGWDIAMIPFALNESTRFISPTKTPEYLSAGVPVISTPIRDVVHPYGTEGLVSIASTTEEFIAAASAILYDKTAGKAWLEKVDNFLSHHSWDATARGILDKIEAVNEKKAAIKN